MWLKLNKIEKKRRKERKGAVVEGRLVVWDIKNKEGKKSGN